MTLYLILHKVRGQPAFDVAEQLEGSGTPSDPGPWWIVSTSGHRAYPFWFRPLHEAAFEMDDKEMALKMPLDLRDHYAINDPTTNIQPARRTRPEPAATTQDLEDLLS